MVQPLEPIPGPSWGSQRKVYQPKSRFSSWLWRIALNLCYDELRSPQRREEPWLGPEDETGDPSFVSSGPTPDRNAARAEEDQLVRKALAALPETYRKVLVLRHYQDLKFPEIAEVLGIPEGTVKSRMAGRLRNLPHSTRPVEDRPTTPRYVAAQIAESSTITLAAAQEHNASLMREFLDLYRAERSVENKALSTVLSRLDASRNADFLSLRTDLEIVALNSDVGLRETQQQLVRLADYSQPRASAPSN